MSAAFRTGYETLSSAQARRVDAVCDRFETAWKTGRRPTIEDYLGELPQPELAVLRRELLLVEVDHRCRGGETPGPDDYRERFPDLDPMWLAGAVLPPTRARPVAAPPRRKAGGSTEVRVPGYEILEELGRGGMGVVYKAWQKSLHRVVALKMLRDDALAGPDQLARFRREAEALAQLQHAHIVHIHDIGEHDGRPYFALEFVDGGSLDQRSSGAPLPAREAAALVATLARAMHYAHQRGIVHRDLKPANVLLAACGLAPGAKPQAAGWVPKITDFGLVKRLLEEEGGQTRSGELLGTPSYMAPEQTASTSHPIGPATDVYALGAILYEMLTGRPPFKAETALATVLQVQRDEPVSLRRLQPTVPRDLETICLRCLEKEPRQRYASAAALADDLGCFREGRPIQARPVGVWRRAGKWARRQPAIAALLATVAVVTALGFAGIVWQLAQKEQALEKVQTTLYYHSLSLAHHEWAAGNLERADQLLDAWRAHRHHWEWRYVHRLCHADLLTCRGHSGPVTGVTFSPDGRRLASASGVWAGTTPGEVKVWDAASGQELFTLGGHIGPVWGVAFSPDGRRLASCSGVWGGGEPGQVKIWDHATGEEVRTLRGHRGSILSVAFSPDGRSLASAGADGKVELWDARTGQPLHTLDGHTGGVFSVAFSPDGASLASGSWDGTACTWDTSTGQRLHLLSGGFRDIRCVAFSPDGRRLATATYTQAVQVWDAVRGELLLTHHVHTYPVFSVAFSPDGRSLASSDGEGLVKVYAALERGEVRTVRGHTGVVTSVAFSPDGVRLATGGRDAAVKVWDVTTDQEFQSLRDHVTRVTSLAFSPDSQRLASAGTSGAGGKEVLVQQVATGQVLHTFTGHTDWVTGVTYSPDGKRLASASLDKTVRLWDAATGQAVAKLEGHAASVTGVAYSPAGEYLASASADGTVKLWDAATGREVRTLSAHTDSVTSVAYSPDGKQLASASQDKTVRVWDAATGQEVRTLLGHTDVVTVAAFSPTGQHLASASADKTVTLWNVRTGRVVFHLAGHTRRVQGLAFSPDGERLASASADWSMKLWDVTTGQEALTLRGRMGEVYGVAFSPDGQLLATGSEDSFRVRLWDARAGRPEVPAPKVHAWHQHEAESSETGRHWFAAAFHLGRLIAAQPNQPHHYLRRSGAHAELGQWDKAAADCARRVELQPDHVSAWYDYAVAYLGLGNRAGHRNVCASLLTRFGQTKNAGTASQALYAILPVADAAADTAHLVRPQE